MGVTVADDYLARIAAVLDEWEGEDAASDLDEALPDCGREEAALFRALLPVTAITIDLGAGKAPGADAGEDAAWAASVALARRDVLAEQARGIDHGLAAGNLRLLDRLEELIGAWPEEDWEDAARRRVQELVDARERGRKRGEELLQTGRGPEGEDELSVGWLLRQPADHWLRQAARNVCDPECRTLIEGQIAKLGPTYQRLCRLDWSVEEAAAEVICELQIVAVSPGRWEEPVPSFVTRPIKGDTSLGEHVAVRLLEHLDGSFNGTLIDVLAGERWLICARELNDGTLLPLDGTRRCAVSGI